MSNIENFDKDGDLICPECGDSCGRDIADNGVCVIYGPWGCYCGWSSDEQYSHNPDPQIDSRGGLTPKSTES